MLPLLLTQCHRRKLPVMCRDGLSLTSKRVGFQKTACLGLKCIFLCVEFKASLKLQAELKAIVVSPHFYMEPIEV